MTTYNASTVSNTAIASGKPVTLQQGRALRDNPLAQGEGSTDAPYIQAAWHPYDGGTIGDGNVGLVYDFAVSGAVASVVTPDFADGYEYRLRYAALSSGNSSVTLQIELYRETSAAYSTARAISASISNTDALYGFTEILRPRITAPGIGVVSLTGLAAMTSDIGGISLSSNQKALKARISFDAGNIDSGTIYMDRRLVHA